ncbi:hypothetical protein [Scleromatobacter humisilvae]|uniref:DUF2530 domain-containing protein n=1 Tax=Scleromatobacter humisilvae TaxID=2897159 RepID=A0A9X1YGN0_9BURK|nr:hypothetical protein [Scleromatobacter humisilvae]MCK9684343.1 hypothetical protein [Scleromatobacter humisilvae]
MSNPRPWFKAKTYGWGWGPATTWQGWLVYACFIALLAGSAVLFRPDRDPLGFALAVAGLCAALVGICLLKGEKPGWRWGR